MRVNKNTGNFESQISNFKFRSSLFDIRYSTLTRASVFCLLLSAFCLLSGCTISPNEIAQKPPVLEVNKAKAMQRARDVLRRMNFKIDKYDPPVSSVEDRNAGYIKTRPLEGAQFFEFWRSDNVGARNFALANLHSIRRTVEINIDNSIDCTVHIQRLSIPEQEVASSARAYSMFSRSSPALQTLVLNPEQQRYTKWIDQGRDKELEKEIIKRIKNKILNSKSEIRNKSKTQIPK